MNWDVEVCFLYASDTNSVDSGGSLSELNALLDLPVSSWG